jgi:hypothetical protein
VSFRTCQIDRVIAVRWQGLDRDDVVRFSLEIQKAHDAARRPLTLLSIIPEDSGLPDQATRKVLGDRGAAVMKNCDTALVIIEGSGVRMSLVRGLIRTLAVLMRTPLRPMMYASVDEALANLPSDLVPQRSRIREALRAAGMITPAHAT